VGLPSSEPPYAWWADFDKSGLVDFGDLSFLAANFGKGRASGQAIGFPTNFPTAWARAPQAAPGDSLQRDGAALPTPEVNGDGRVTPLDALILINAIHERSARGQANAVNTPDLQPPYLDPNLDGYLTPADVLAVINYLNGIGGSLGGEGEPSGGLSLAAPANADHLARTMARPAPSNVIFAADVPAGKGEGARPSFAAGSSARAGRIPTARTPSQPWDRTEVMEALDPALAALDGVLSDIAVDVAFARRTG
jgi:hypothetical protein